VLVLEKLLGSKELDFILVLSSLSSILAGIGFVAYAAANAFLDSFAVARNLKGGTPWFSVDWDNWTFAENPDPTVATDTALLPREGVETFRRIVGHGGFQHVAVSATDLQVRIDQWINFKSASAAAIGEVVPLHARPDLATEHVPPGNKVEQTIAGIWQELLGIDQIGIHDDFFELGGQSLLATQLVARVRAALNAELPLRRFFEGPTVAALALAIAPKANQAPTIEEELTEAIAV
jgi:acyl carrier protein